MLDNIFHFLAPDLEDVISFGLARRSLHQFAAKALATAWAAAFGRLVGTKIAIVDGDTPPEDLPCEFRRESLFQELAEGFNRAERRAACGRFGWGPFTRRGAVNLSLLARVRFDLLDPQPAMILFFEDLFEMDSLLDDECTSPFRELEFHLDEGDFVPLDDSYVLRNRTLRHFVRSKTVYDACKDERDLKWGARRALSRIFLQRCRWDAEHRGMWAGHAFDISVVANPSVDPIDVFGKQFVLSAAGFELLRCVDDEHLVFLVPGLLLPEDENTGGEACAVKKIGAEADDGLQKVHPEEFFPDLALSAHAK